MPTAPTEVGTASTESSEPNEASTASTGGGASEPTMFDRSGPGGGSPNVSQDVAFPPRNEPFDFRLRLETQYQSVLRRAAQTSFVDIEGTIVWTQEYLRYRVNGCGQAEAISRVTAQILGQGVQPICQDFTGTTVNFPPRDQPFAFRQELERIYRDVLRRGAVQSFVDTEGDIVWTQEYLRYRVNNCSHTEAVDRVLAQTLGAAVQPTCGPGTLPIPPPTDGGGGDIENTVVSISAPGATVEEAQRPRPNAGAGPVVGVANAGQFVAGGTNTVTLTASQPVTNLFVSLNTVPGSLSVGAQAVTDSFFVLRFSSPQTSIPVSLRLRDNVASRFILEFGGQGANGDVGNFAQLPVTISTNPTCTYALLNGTTNFGSGGGSGTVNVSVQPGCGWTLGSNQPFVALSQTSGSGSVTVSYSVAPNTGQARSARLTLTGTQGGGATFDISQAASPCSYSVSTNTTNFTPSGGTLNVTVTTGPTCGWSASSLSSFITGSGNTSGTGTGTAVFSVASNSTTSSRSGTVRVAFTATGGSQDIGINQAGQTVPPPVAIILNPSTCAVNTSCAFNGSSSQGQITSWEWEFGDNTVGSGPMVTHTYATNFIPPFSSQVVSVRLTVTGPGGSNSATSTVRVTRSY